MQGWSLSAGSDTMQAPPQSDQEIRDMLLKVYGLTCGIIIRLDGYEDKNYKLEDVKLVSNPHITSLPAYGCILKVTNPMDASIPGLTEGQTSLILHVKQHGLKSPAILPCKDGKTCSFELINGFNLPVRLMETMPGITAKRAAHYTPRLYYQLGEAVGHFRRAVENDLRSGPKRWLYVNQENAETTDFDHEVYNNYYTYWSLCRCPDILSITNILETEQKRKLVIDAISQFKEKVLPISSGFKQGQIHSDANESNFLVISDDSCPGELTLSALIDFNDSHKSCFIFDLAITIAYMMMEETKVPFWDIGGYILGGYRSALEHKSDISDEEMASILPSMAARVAQSVTLGWHSWHQNPVDQNRYVLVTQEKGWALLEELWDKRHQNKQILDQWETIGSEYRHK